MNGSGRAASAIALLICALGVNSAGAAGDEHNLSKKAQRQTAAVALPSLSPIVDTVLPAVVNVAVTLSPGAGADTDEDTAPRSAPKAPRDASPFDQFLHRFFNRQRIERHGGDDEGDDPDEHDQGGDLDPGGAHLALGSGFVIDPAGYIVTNNHVVAQGSSITVAFQDNSKHSARVVGRDPKTDLALLKIEADKPLPYVAWGDSDRAKVGDWVMAVGNPFGLGGSVTAGVISARGRDIEAGPYDDFLQIDAPINRGNSGGPTFDMTAQVIGINTAIFSPNGGSIGIGFAIPANIAQPVIEQLKRNGKVVRGWLGVQAQEITPPIAESLGRAAQSGALVSGVIKNSPAAQVGLKQGDVIETFDGKKVGGARDLSLAVAASQVGKTVPLEVWRRGKKVQLSAQVGEMPPDSQNADADQDHASGSATAQHTSLGLLFAPLDRKLRRSLGVDRDTQGVVVAAVAPDSPARGALQVGDVIQAIDHNPVDAPTSAISALEQAHRSGKKKVLLLINRGGNDQFVGLPLG